MAVTPEEASLLHSFFWENPSWPPVVADHYNNSVDSSSRGGCGGGGCQETMAPLGSKKMNREGREGSKESSSGGDNDKNNNRVMKEGKVSGGGGGESEEHDIHIWTERERRKKMRTMFANLHALLPRLSPKADKSTIVDEAVNYIKTLQQNLQKLQKKKLERLQGVATFGYEPPSSTSIPEKQPLNSREAFLADQGSSSNLAVEAISNIMNSRSWVSASAAPVVFQTWTSPNVVLNICGDEAHISVCSSNKLGLFSAICCVFEKHNIEVISAQVSSNSNRRMFMFQAQVNRGSDQLIDAVPAEEIYKQAAGELTLWFSS